MKRKGFTLVEVMIVVAIIALLAAISIPNLLRARLNANETAAIAGLRTIVTGQHGYRTGNSNYAAALTDLSGATPPYIDSALGSGNKQGYTFTLGVGNSTMFAVVANPQIRNKTGSRSFCVTDEGIIYYQANTDYATNATTCAGTQIQ